MVGMVFHITSPAQWAEALSQGAYHHQSLHDEGFIHCSDPDQLLRTASKHFPGQSDLIILCISPDLLKAPLVYEDSYNKGEAFPHIYGPLNLDAVRHVFNFPINENGLFMLPENLYDTCRDDEEPTNAAAGRIEGS